jgi:ribose transport system substrate-binding protein
MLSGCSNGGGTSNSGTGSGDGKWTPQSIAEKYGTTEFADSWHSLALSIIEDRATGAQAAAQALGQTYRGISADFNAVKQLSDVSAAIGTGVKVLNVVPLEAPSVNSFAPQACDAKVYFTTSYNSPSWRPPSSYCEYYSAYTGPNDFETGVITATKLAEALKGKGNIVHITGLKGATSDQLRTAGMESVLSKYPNIKLVRSVDTDWTGQAAYDKFSSILATSSEPIDGVIAADDDLGIGAFNAAKAVGQAPLIVSSDGTREVFGVIAANKNYLGTVDTGSTFIGGWLVVRAFDALHGFKPTEAETMMYWPIKWVDKSSAADSLKAAQNPEWDWAKMSRVLYPDDWNTQGQLFTTMDPSVVWQTEPEPAGFTMPDGLSKEARAETDTLYADHQN